MNCPIRTVTMRSGRHSSIEEAEAISVHAYDADYDTMFVAAVAQSTPGGWVVVNCREPGHAVPEFDPFDGEQARAAAVQLGRLYCNVVPTTGQNTG